MHTQFVHYSHKVYSYVKQCLSLVHSFSRSNKQFCQQTLWVCLNQWMKQRRPFLFVQKWLQIIRKEWSKGIDEERRQKLAPPSSSVQTKENGCEVCVFGTMFFSPYILQEWAVYRVNGQCQVKWNNNPPKRKLDSVGVTFQCTGRREQRPPPRSEY